MTPAGPVLPSCRSQHQEVSFSTRATEGMGETGRKLQWWFVAAKFCVKQKQSPEVAVLAVALPKKGRHCSKPQPAPAGLHPEPCRAGWIYPGDRDPDGHHVEEQLWGLSQGMLCSLLLCLTPRSRGLWATKGFDCGEGPQLPGCPWGDGAVPWELLLSAPQMCLPCGEGGQGSAGPAKRMTLPNSFLLCGGGFFGFAVVSPGLLGPL